VPEPPEVLEEHSPRMSPHEGLSPRGRIGAVVRTPFLLARFPGILFAIVMATLILGVATAASPLFLSSASTAAIRQVTAAAGNVPAVSLAVYDPIVQDAADFRNDKLYEITDRIDHLGPAVETVVGQREDLTNPLAPNQASPPTVLATRTGAEDHVDFVRGGPGKGLWVADSVARPISLEVGDTVRFGSDPSVRARVAGIYRNLAPLPRDDYWAPVAGLVYPINPNAPAPPPLLLAPRAEFFRIGSALNEQGQYRWEFPLETGDITLPEAQRLSGSIASLIGQVSDPTSEVGSNFNRPASNSPVPQLVTQAAHTVSSLEGPVGTLAIAGRVVAFAVVAAAGLFLVTRRRVEFTFLHARGVGPVRTAGKSVAETILPAMLGAAAGLVLAVQLVKLLGPTDVVTRAAIEDAARSVFWSTIAAVVVLGLVVAVAARSESEARMGGRLRTVAARFPWEVIVLALAAASYYEVVTRGTAPVEDGGAPTVDRLLLLFPILFIAGMAGLAVRALRRGLPRLRAYGSGLRPAPYLAIRRLSAVSKLATTLVTAAALGIGILIFAGVFTSSVQRTANTKALVSVGSDVSVPLGVYPDTPPKEKFASTAVAELGGVELQPGGINGTVMGIDPKTFKDAAFWDPSFSSKSEDDILGFLADDSSGRLPVLVAGADVPNGPGSMNVQSIDLPIDVIGHAQAFPGMPSDQALFVTAVGPLQKSLNQVGASLGAFNGINQLWAKGDTATVLRQLHDAGYPDELAITADAVRQTPGFLSLSWVFGFLEALGVMAGLVALVALVLYLQARQRSREVAYVLSRRMGLRKRSNFVSVVLELGGMLLASFVIGAGLAVAAAFLLYRKADPMPQIPPDPLLQLPYTLFLITLAGLALAAVISAWRVQRSAEKANVAEVMRLAGG
jgi:putative ABC transport system permease protein